MLHESFYCSVQISDVLTSIGRVKPIGRLVTPGKLLTLHEFGVYLLVIETVHVWPWHLPEKQKQLEYTKFLTPSRGWIEADWISFGLCTHALLSSSFLWYVFSIEGSNTRLPAWSYYGVRTGHGNTLTWPTSAQFACWCSRTAECLDLENISLDYNNNTGVPLHGHELRRAGHGRGFECIPFDEPCGRWVYVW